MATRLKRRGQYQQIWVVSRGRHYRLWSRIGGKRFTALEPPDFGPHPGLPNPLPIWFRKATRR